MPGSHLTAGVVSVGSERIIQSCLQFRSVGSRTYQCTEHVQTSLTDDGLCADYSRTGPADVRTLDLYRARVGQLSFAPRRTSCYWRCVGHTVIIVCLVDVVVIEVPDDVIIYLLLAVASILLQLTAFVAELFLGEH